MTAPGAWGRQAEVVAQGVALVLAEGAAFLQERHDPVDELVQTCGCEVRDEDEAVGASVWTYASRAAATVAGVPMKVCRAVGSLDLAPGECLATVGESGFGKSTVARHSIRCAPRSPGRPRMHRTRAG